MMKKLFGDGIILKGLQLSKSGIFSNITQRTSNLINPDTSGADATKQS
jgi:hypothetical protein